MTKFKCVMISRVEIDVDIPDGTYYNHSVLDEAVKKRYGEDLAGMLMDKAYMEHFTRVKE